MWPIGVFVFPPSFDQFLCRAEAVEDFAIAHFITEAGIETFI